MLSAILNESPVVEDGHQKPFRSSCMSVVDGHVHINGFSTLPESIRMAIEVALSSNGVTAKAIEDDILRIPRQVSTAQGDFNMAAVLGRITGFVVDKRLKLTKDVKRDYPDTLDVEDILIRARVFGEFIEKVGPHSAHLHIADASGVDGEGLQIGEGDIDLFAMGHSLATSAPNVSFIPEIWQGHKNGGEGFWKALDRLEPHL